MCAKRYARQSSAAALHTFYKMCDGSYVETGEKFGDVGGVEFADYEALFAEVFERGAEEIDVLVVDDQEAVVKVAGCLDGESAVLGVEADDVVG